MKRLRILALVPTGSVPPESLEDMSEKQIEDLKMEYDVLTALRQLRHETRCLGVCDDLRPIREAIEEWKPHVVFNMLEEFHGYVAFDQNVVSYLELLRVPYTGCNPRGLVLSRDKALTKKILSYHRIRVPGFAVFPRGRRLHRPKRLAFPLLVKSLTEEASSGISQASLVSNDEQLAQRVAFVHEHTLSDAIAEEYIEGRELYLGVLGNHRLETFPLWEMIWKKLPDGMPRIATARVKFNVEYRKKYGIVTRAAKGLPEGVADRVARLGKRIYRVLDLSGYARLDMRLREDGQLFVLEANPNPDLSHDEDFSKAAEAGGIPYNPLIRRILGLGLRYHATWYR
ncbi:MAG: D-alanine--D-alanine ligase family protein [Planctomycetota bacterium]|jgi:D-alanine-D-alanine ligase